MTAHAPHRRRAAAVLAGIVVATAIGASAASLGGLGSDELGADNGIVASCDTNGMDVRYVKRYHAPTDGYRVQTVVLQFVSAACDGLPFQLTVTGSDGNTYEASGAALDVRNIRDRQPGPGVDMAGVARIRVRFPAEILDGIAIVIGGTSTP